MVGLTIVLAIPYFLLKKKGGKGGAATSFAQMLHQSKKKVNRGGREVECEVGRRRGRVEWWGCNVGWGGMVWSVL